jgi:hypothetical protein
MTGVTGSAQQDEVCQVCVVLQTGFATCQIVPFRFASGLALIATKTGERLVLVLIHPAESVRLQG